MIQRNDPRIQREIERLADEGMRELKKRKSQDPQKAEEVEMQPRIDDDPMPPPREVPAEGQAAGSGDMQDDAESRKRGSEDGDERNVRQRVHEPGEGVMTIAAEWNEDLIQIGRQHKGSLRMTDVPGFACEILTGGDGMDVDEEVERKVRQVEDGEFTMVIGYGGSSMSDKTG